MTWLALLLLGVGAADVVASLWPEPRVPDAWRRWVAPAAGGVLVVLVAALAGLSGPDWLAVAYIIVGLLAWRLFATGAEISASRARLALAALFLPGAVLVAFSGFAHPVGGPLAAWLGWIDLPALRHFTPQRILLLAGLALANTSTANTIVRLVLVSIHAEPPRLNPVVAEPAPPSEKLRGGRLLGPMERLLIIGFGAAGYVEAAGLVIAAKGLLRFPELQAAARLRAPAVDEVTEYFLVGTFTSLLVALASVVLLA